MSTIHIFSDYQLCKYYYFSKLYVQNLRESNKTISDRHLSKFDSSVTIFLTFSDKSVPNSLKIHYNSTKCNNSHFFTNIWIFLKYTIKWMQFFSGKPQSNIEAQWPVIVNYVSTHENLSYSFIIPILKPQLTITSGCINKCHILRTYIFEYLELHLISFWFTNSQEVT